LSRIFCTVSDGIRLVMKFSLFASAASVCTRATFVDRYSSCETRPLATQPMAGKNKDMRAALAGAVL
jgi:hypothetical protein